MIDRDKIAELRRLEAEATPGEWEVSEDNILINEDDEIGELILWSDKDIALIVAMRNALPDLLKALETPVAWRTRQRVGPYAPYSWAYTDSQIVSLDDEVYETEPLFALPPHGGRP